MVKHIICVKLKDKSQKEEVKQVFLSMWEKVPQIKKIEVGTDFLESERSYDVILMVDLQNRAELDAYQNDPYHAAVVKPYIHAVRVASVAVDYEF